MYYLIILLVYLAVDAIACLGLSQQFGVAGVTNFGFIIFQAAGAYVAAVLALPPDTADGGFQTYLGGYHLPFPVPWLGAALAGGVLALPFTFLVGRRLRGDFAAVGLLVTAVLANLLVMNYKPLLNGDAGLALVPAPLQSQPMTTTSTSSLIGSRAIRSRSALTVSPDIVPPLKSAARSSHRLTSGGIVTRTLVLP